MRGAVGGRRPRRTHEAKNSIRTPQGAVMTRPETTPNGVSRMKAFAALLGALAILGVGADARAKGGRGPGGGGGSGSGGGGVACCSPEDNVAGVECEIRSKKACASRGDGSIVVSSCAACTPAVLGIESGACCSP